jgi:hypothetical protein
LARLGISEYLVIQDFPIFRQFSIFGPRYRFFQVKKAENRTFCVARWEDSDAFYPKSLTLFKVGEKWAELNFMKKLYISASWYQLQKNAIFGKFIRFLIMLKAENYKDCIFRWDEQDKLYLRPAISLKVGEKCKILKISAFFGIF